jgi:hypothetical protein
MCFEKVAIGAIFGAVVQKMPTYFVTFLTLAIQVGQFAWLVAALAAGSRPLLAGWRRLDEQAVLEERLEVR